MATLNISSILNLLRDLKENETFRLEGVGFVRRGPYACTCAYPWLSRLKGLLKIFYPFKKECLCGYELQKVILLGNKAEIQEQICQLRRVLKGDVLQFVYGYRMHRTYRRFSGLNKL